MKDSIVIEHGRVMTTEKVSLCLVRDLYVLTDNLFERDTHFL
jgi:hypothetical protein